MIRPFNGTESDLETLLAILIDSQRVLDPAFVAAGIGFERERWATSVRDPQTEWALACAPNGSVAGFAGWRYLPGLSHLHALFVGHEHQCRGYGSALIRYHWRAVLLQQPITNTFTLHVREPAYWAQALYERHGYRLYQPGDERQQVTLLTWIDACRRRDNWPLPVGKRLMWRPGGAPCRP